MQHCREQAHIDYQEQYQGRALSESEALTLIETTIQGWEGQADLPVEWQRSYLDAQCDAILARQQRYALQLPTE